MITLVLVLMVAFIAAVCLCVYLYLELGEAKRRIRDNSDAFARQLAEMGKQTDAAFKLKNEVAQDFSTVRAQLESMQKACRMIADSPVDVEFTP